MFPERKRDHSESATSLNPSHLFIWSDRRPSSRIHAELRLTARLWIEDIMAFGQSVEPVLEQGSFGILERKDCPSLHRSLLH